MPDPIVSHGRGGAANIGADSTPYTDGEIVREGPVGDQGDGAFSTGRGGAANIGSPGLKPTHAAVGDGDVIPEAAMRRPSQENYHVGRGGQGNVHAQSGPAPLANLADQLKNKLFKKKPEEK
ncbi:hypothetical protein MMC24_000454 [Lignoscripta atroalba]|nr:hypothetical protein [Lignoscripta atroalba]